MSLSDSPACPASTASSGHLRPARTTWPGPPGRRPSPRAPAAGPSWPARGTVPSPATANRAGCGAAPNGPASFAERRSPISAVPRKGARTDGQTVSRALRRPPSLTYCTERLTCRIEPPRGGKEAAYEKVQGICPGRARFADSDGKAKSAPKLISAPGARGKVLPETNVTQVPMRVFRPSLDRSYPGASAQFGSREPVVKRLISGRAGRQFRGHSQLEKGLGRPAVFDPPVLVQDSAVLGFVEPHQPERLVGRHPVEQVLDLVGLAGGGPDRGLRQQHRLAGQRLHLVDGLAEHAREGIARMVVIPVDADPGHVMRPRPEGSDRPGTGLVGLNRPHPGDVAGDRAAEKRDKMRPGG